jgi:hypothetical protein
LGQALRCENGNVALQLIIETLLSAGDSLKSLPRATPQCSFNPDAEHIHERARRPALQLPVHIYHLAEAANWPSIQLHGLLSTSALLDLAALPKNKRDRYEQHHRPDHIELTGGIHIRDQKPMPVEALQRCLVDLTPAEWYRLLNGKVFFWLDPNRLNRQRGACAQRAQIVLIVATAQLMSRHADQVSLCPINSGNARRKPALRGRSTFVPYAEWLKSGWSSEARGLGIRGRTGSHRPVELTVERAIQDIMECLVDVQWLAPGEQFQKERVMLI